MKNTITTSLWCRRARSSRALLLASSIREIQGSRARWPLPGTKTSRPAWVWLIRPPPGGIHCPEKSWEVRERPASEPASASIMRPFEEGETLGLISDNAPYGFTYTSPAPPLFTTPFVDAATGNVGDPRRQEAVDRDRDRRSARARPGLPGSAARLRRRPDQRRGLRRRCRLGDLPHRPP